MTIMLYHIFDKSKLGSILKDGLFNANMLGFPRPNDLRMSLKHDDIFFHPLRNDEKLEHIPNFDQSVYCAMVFFKMDNLVVNNRMYSYGCDPLYFLNIEYYLKLDHVPFNNLPEVRIRTPNIPAKHIVSIMEKNSNNIQIIYHNDNSDPYISSINDSLMSERNKHIIRP
jgi:hypothetical protein